MEHGLHFAEDIFKYIFIKEKKLCILITISPKFVSEGPVEKTTLV